MRSPEFKVGPKSNYSVHASQLLQLWTVAHKAALSMGFPRQEYWSGLPCLPPGDLPDLGIKPASLWVSPPLEYKLHRDTLVLSGS